MNSPLPLPEDNYALRPRVEGKFLVIDNEKFYIRGVTYGTFRPNENGENFPPPSVVEKDFALMSSFGINSVRTYTVPPIYILDCARKHNLRVLVGLPWEQHITFLDDEKQIEDIERRIYEAVRSCENHPAVLAYTLGNEIPAPVVRWYGKNRVENFLEKLYDAAKRADPNGLFTYVNYPTTEYLNLPFTDFDCFNVYLESKEKLESYLARLHNICGDRPLLMAEIGLDSRRNGEEVQADSLEWQIRSVFASGCAGAFIFAWTDEWWRGGFEIDDWDFGLTSRERLPKPALHKVSQALRETPFSPNAEFPKLSVVVCSYNGSATLRETLEALRKVEYPDFEVIVVNDGSTDSTPEIAVEYAVRLISTPNRGLSSARNTGMEAATGEIVAYVDDDAYPDPHWLQYLAHAFTTTDFAGVGGPNIPPQGDGMIAESVANAPGGPSHVLTSDQIAEHIPGCNMAFRRDALLEVGGFDPVYRAAGDDVDLCWKIQASGRKIGFHPSAVVWHHRRNSVKAYWRQQKGYGKAEALLEEKWTQKYNSFGHASWNGRIYGSGLTLPLQVEKERIFHGIWGTSLFQSIYQPSTGLFTSILLMPEWYFIIAGLFVLFLLGFLWQPLFLAFPPLLASVAVVLFQAGMSATKAVYATAPKDDFERFYRWGLTAFLHIIQPLARLKGRFTYDILSRRSQGIDNLPIEFVVPKSRYFSIWSEEWKSNEDWVRSLEAKLIKSKTKVRRGGEFDRYDLEANIGMSAFCRALLLVEEHGAGKQLVRLRCRTRYSMFGSIPFTALVALSIFAAFDDAFAVAVILSGFSLLIGVAMISDAARATRIVSIAFSKLNRTDTEKTGETAAEIDADPASTSEFAKPHITDADAVSTMAASNSAE
jgi:glycosyltransferase involved in cell wall biosynthesis